MKRMYWKPRKVSGSSLALLCALSLAGLCLVEQLPTQQAAPGAAEKLAAARRAELGMEVIKQHRLSLGHTFHPEHDPAQSGMIGDLMTPITSVSGHLGSKQTSINPNFAAVVVEMLQQAGVGKGDTVAVGCSGSFPAINLCVFAALETLEARPIAIASASASQFGANRPDLLWIDMEQLLADRQILSFRSRAASLGGYNDTASGVTPEARQLLRDAIARRDLRLIEAESFTGSIDERMRIYDELAGGEPIAAYINIGGGTTSVGRSLGKKLYHPGLNLSPPPGATSIDSVMTRFAKAGVPLVHMVEIPKLATQYQLPMAPTKTPSVGNGPLYHQPHASRTAAGVLLGFILISLQGFVLTDFGPRLLLLLLHPLRRFPIGRRLPHWQAETNEQTQTATG